MSARPSRDPALVRPESDVLAARYDVRRPPGADDGPAYYWVQASRAPEPFYGSNHFVAAADRAGDVQIHLILDDGPVERLTQAIERAFVGVPIEGKTVSEKVWTKVFDSVRLATVDVLERRFQAELDGLTAAYGTLLRESMAKGDDADLRSALNKARLREKILAGATMVDQEQACILLGLSAANPSATMKRKEDRGEVLRFVREGRVSYPLFQFDVDNRRIYPAIARMIADKPETWSDIRLLHWLTQPHADFGDAPATALATRADAVLAAYGRAIQPQVHG